MGNNRTKGHRVERLYAKAFRELGWDKCVTSRYGSRQHDDCAIDLINIPFNVQIKAGYARGLNYKKVLEDMAERVAVTFSDTSEEASKIKILIHHKDAKRGKERSEFDDLVTMSFKDFKRMI